MEKENADETKTQTIENVETEVDANRLFDELTHKYIQRFTQTLLYPMNGLDWIKRYILEMFMELRSKVVRGEKLETEAVLEFKKLIEADNHDSNP